MNGWNEDLINGERANCRLVHKTTTMKCELSIMHYDPRSGLSLLRSDAESTLLRCSRMTSFHAYSNPVTHCGLSFLLSISLQASHARPVRSTIVSMEIA